ncbi:MAG: hypothetical protein JNL18_18565 [Planctomycetaceae bacterium]|nr:hypothetical protein [Planctomycetaceae bacterium]
MLRYESEHAFPFECNVVSLRCPEYCFLEALAMSVGNSLSDSVDSRLLKAIAQITSASSYRMINADINSQKCAFSSIAIIGSLASHIGKVHLECTYLNTRIAGELAKCSWTVDQFPMVSIAFSEAVEEQFKFNDPCGRIFRPSLMSAVRDLFQSVPLETASELCVAFRVQGFTLREDWIGPFVEAAWESIREEVEADVSDEFPEPPAATLPWHDWRRAIRDIATDRFFDRFRDEFDSLRNEISNRVSESIRAKLASQ